jgi:hypothetical protein
MARRIEFEVVVDSDGAVTALRQVMDTAEETGEQIEEMGEEGAKSARNLGNSFKQLQTAFLAVSGGVAAVAAAITAAAAGAALAVGKVTLEVVELAAEADSIAKLATTLGTTAEELQTLQGALALGGVGAQTAEQAIRDLNLRLGDAALNSGATSAALERLGLTAQQLEALPLAERFALIADRLQEVESQSLKTRTAADLMGESGIRLLSAFAGGGEAIRSAAEAIEQAGIISNRAARQSEALTDSVSIMSASFAALRADALTPLIPAVAAVANQLASLAQVIRRSIDFEEIGQTIEDALVNRAIPAITGFGAIAVASFAEVEAQAQKLRASVRLVAAASTGDIRGMQAALVEFGTAQVDTEEVTATILNFARAMATAQDEVRDTLQSFRAMQGAVRDTTTTVQASTLALESNTEAVQNLNEAEDFASQLRRERVATDQDIVIGGLRAIADARQAERDRQRQQAEEERQEAKDLAGSVLNSSLSIISIIQRAEQDALSQRVREEEAAADRVRSIREQLARATTERTRERLREELDAAIASQRIAEEQARQAFARTKALALGQAVISTAQAVASALAVPPAPNVPLAIAAGALGGAQIAAIASEPAPSFHSGGLLRDEMLIRARQGEAILSPAAVSAAGGEEGVRALNQGRPTGPTTLVVQQKLRTRVLDAQVYDLGRSGRGSLQNQIHRGQPRPGSHRPTGMG